MPLGIETGKPPKGIVSIAADLWMKERDSNCNTIGKVECCPVQRQFADGRMN